MITKTPCSDTFVTYLLCNYEAKFSFIDDEGEVKGRRRAGRKLLGGGSTCRTFLYLIVIRSLHRSDRKCQIAGAICPEVFITCRPLAFLVWGRRSSGKKIEEQRGCAG